MRVFSYSVVPLAISAVHSVDKNAEAVFIEIYNFQIKRGETRGVDLGNPPYCLSGKKVLTYQGEPGVIKQVILISGSKL